MPRIMGAEWGLVALRFLLGIFFVFEGWDKLPWFWNPDLLGSILTRWVETATPLSKWYLQNFALPGVPVFARLVFLGEVAIGMALIFGAWTRYAALIGLLLVLNIHFAHSELFKYSFLSKGDGLPVLGGLLALVMAGARLPLSLKKA